MAYEKQVTLRDVEEGVISGDAGVAQAIFDLIPTHAVQEALRKYNAEVQQRVKKAKDDIEAVADEKQTAEAKVVVAKEAKVAEAAEAAKDAAEEKAEKAKEAAEKAATAAAEKAAKDAAKAAFRSR